VPQGRHSQEEVDRRWEAITAGILVSGNDCHITFANRAASKILGRVHADLVGQRSSFPGWEATREDGSLLPSEEDPATIALATGNPVYGCVVGLRSPTGASRWILVDSEPVFDNTATTVEAVVTTFVDVTPLKDAQAALRDAERRFRLLLETTSDWVWEVDENFVYTYASPRVRDLLGYEPETVLGKAPWDFMPPEEASRVSKLAAGARESRQPFALLENINVHKSGRLVVLETSGAPFFDELGRFRGYRGIDRDISDRKRAENSLRASEAFLRSITDLVPSRISYVDRELRYRFVNGRYEEWFGRRREDIVGRHAREVLGDSLYERIQPHFQAALSGREVRYELDIGVGEGAPRHLSIVYVPHFGEHGEILGFFASLEDITERKRLEEQLRQSQKMEAVGVLAGGIAHDFNNLLTVINGYSRLALDQLDKNDPLRRNIEEVAQAGARAASLTQQLLAFSRKQMLQPKVLDLNACVAGLEMMLRRLIEERIDLRIDLDPSLACVRADPAQVEQIVMNLVVNARDAMPEGGRLMIETRNVRLNVDDCGGQSRVQPGDYVMLAVSDTGRGMDAETQRRIFEPFFTTKGVGRGTGLGLSTIYGIVEQSGGHISVDSEPGRGAKFKIHFPAIGEAAEAMQPASPTAEARAGTGTVLLVEDEPALRRMVRQALSQRGYTVLEATDGENALQVSERHQGTIDLLLTDVVMPRLGGPELAERLMQRRPKMKVLYISGYAETVIADQRLTDARAEFLQKPFATDDLVRKVGKLLGSPKGPSTN
jgi:two-component system, cell cycle sensor histidine kinase and response regulator CckA